MSFVYHKLRNLDALKNLFGSKLLLRIGFSMRENLRAAKKEFEKTEDDLKSLQRLAYYRGNS